MSIYRVNTTSASLWRCVKGTWMRFLKGKFVVGVLAGCALGLGAASRKDEAAKQFALARALQ